MKRLFKKGSKIACINDKDADKLKLGGTYVVESFLEGTYKGEPFCEVILYKKEKGDFSFSWSQDRFKKLKNK